MLRQLFNNPSTYPDFTITCQDKRWLLHRACLCQIPYFATLFQREAFVENQRKTLDVQDVSSDTVEAVLKYLYEIPTNLPWDQAEKTFLLAEQWFYLDYKGHLIEQAILGTSSSDDHPKIWQFLGKFGNTDEYPNRYQRKFIVNLWEKYSTSLVDPEISRQVIKYAQTRGDPKIVFYLCRCLEINILTSDEFTQHLSNIALTDVHFTDETIFAHQKNLAPSYLDTLIANYYTRKVTSNKKCLRYGCKNKPILQLSSLCSNHNM